MAGLEVVIGADIDDLKTGIAKAQTEIEKLTKQKSANIKVGIDTTDLQKQINESKNKLDTLKKSLASTGSAMQGFAPKVANGGNALMQFSRIAQDAPYGIIGIGNNITATVESFGHLKQATGSSGAALKAMASSLLGSGGILLAVSLVTTGLTYMSQNGITVGDVFKKLTGTFDANAAALNKLNGEAAKNASGGVSEMNAYVSVAGNLNLSMSDRLIAVRKLQDEYPAYFGNLSKENILNGNVAGAVREVTKALVAKAKAAAYTGKITELALEQVGLRDKETIAINNAKKAIKKFNDSETNRALLVKETNEIIAGTRTELSAQATSASLITLQYAQAKQELLEIQNEVRGNISAQDKWTKLINESTAAAIKLETVVTKGKKPAKTFSTPQVSSVKSSVSPNNNLIDLNTIKTLTGEVDKFGNKITELPNVIKTGMDKTKIALDTGFIDALETMQKFNDEANAIIVGSLTSTFTNLGTAIGDALASGKNVFGAIGNSLLASLGGFLSEMGALLIKYGVLAVAKGTLDVAMTVPVVGIAAGAAAIAVGVALSSAGGAMSSRAKQGTSGSSGGGLSTGGSYSSPASSSSYSSSGGGMGSGTVVFEISGTSLVGVLSNTLDKNKRLGGNLPI
jgi:hypothetical protein